jgi:8-oxo-dGTP diphosphatase
MGYAVNKEAVPLVIDRQIVTVDIVLLTIVEGRLTVGLIEREQPPFAGRLALIGGYVHADTDVDTDATAQRVLSEKTRLEGFHLEQLATFSGPTRDPRGWSISVAYLALTPFAPLHEAMGVASPVRLVPADAVSDLPFDHTEILSVALARLRSKGAYSTLPARLLPSAFTLTELQDAYRIALNVPRIDKSSFRRKLSELGLVEPFEGKRTNTGGRQAQLYRLKEDVATFGRRI